MQRLLVSALLITSACGSDAKPDSNNNNNPPVPCNPIGQTGCAAGEKCTWISIDSNNALGKSGCVADGTVAELGDCQWGPDGETTGFDNCAAPGVCVGGKCEQVCTLAPDSCPNSRSCARYSTLFKDMQPELGICDYDCDPVTQVRLEDSAAACGSPDPGNPTRGCYGTFDGPFLCAGALVAAQGLTQGMTAYGPGGGAFLNGCAVGFAPLLRSSASSTSPIICVAFCRPAETFTGNTAGATGVPASGYQCADRGASGAGIECKFMWYFANNPTTDRNTWGVCWQPGDYVSNWDNNVNTPDAAHPACVDLPNTDTDGDTIPQHYQFGCAPYVP